VEPAHLAARPPLELVPRTVRRLIGATIAALGLSGLNWTGDGSKLDGVIGKVILPAVRWGQIASASLVSLAHGTNDAQKTMGVITLALIASGHWTDPGAVPFWVKLSCALAIAVGTYLGGWRIIRTLGKGLVEISSPQGMAAESSSAAVILASSHLGFALSTTHVATGSILGTGLGRPGAVVRWRVAMRMVVAWCITLPSAAVVGAAMWWLGHLVGGVGGGLAIVVVLVALGGFMFVRSRRTPVHAGNVNEEWADDAAPVRTPTTV
jgi:PiT family inorganic phosphate transporter